MIRYILSIFLLLHQVSANSDIAPSQFAYLEKWNLTKDSQFIIQMPFTSTLLAIGYRGSSSNVTILIQNWVNSSNPQKKANYYDFSYIYNLTQAKGNITSIVYTMVTDKLTISSSDQTIRVYHVDPSRAIGANGRFIRLAAEFKETSPIVMMATDFMSMFTAVLNLEGALKVYCNFTIPQQQASHTSTTTIISDNQSPKANTTTNKSLTNSSSNTTIKYTQLPFQYRVVQQYKPPNQVTTIAFSYNQTVMYVGYDNGSVVLYFYNQVTFKFPYVSHFTDTNKKITGIETDMNQKYLLTASEDTFVRVYKLNQFREAILIQGIYDAGKPIIRMQMRRDASQFAISTQDGLVRLYSRQKDKFTFTQSWYINTTNIQFALCDYGTMIAIAGNGQMKIYQACSHSILHCIKCDNLNTCLQCQDNYYLDHNGYCDMCSTFQGCKTCITQNMCTSCYEGYFLNVEIGVCQPCSHSLKNCKSCSSKYDCKQCFMEFKLNNGFCQFPVNPNIPKLTPISNKSIEQHKITPIITPVKAQKWTITLIVLIIILCILISIMLIIMIFLCTKLIKKTKSRAQLDGEIKKNDVEAIPQVSEQIKDDINELNEPPEIEQKQNGVIIIALEPQQKGEDKFKELRA